jgi:hypothetical protein
MPLCWKLKQDLVDSTPSPIDKKPRKDEQTCFLTESQLRLLDVCGYKGYSAPISFAFSMEANRFVDGYAIKKNNFVEQHSKMLALGSNFSTLLSKLIIFFPVLSN